MGGGVSSSRREALAGLLAFTIPVLLAFPLRLVGQFYGGELVALALIPLAIRCRHWILSNRAIRLLFGTGVLWLGALIISDIWRGTSARDMFRGWGEIALMLLMLAVLRMLVGDDLGRLRLALLGTAAGMVVRIVFVPTIADQVAPWSLGGAWAITIMILFLVPALPAPFRRISPEVLLTLLAVFAAAEGARNAAGATMLTAAYLGILRVSRHRLWVPATKRRTVTIALLLLAVGSVLFLAYSSASSSGVLGDEAAAKYARQSSGSLGALVGGRQDNVVTLLAIADSPLLGHGSRAVGRVYIEEAADLLHRLGHTPYQWESDEIPRHSYILGAWLSAGIAGLAFWLVVLSLAWRALVRTGGLSMPWAAITAFLSIGLMWDILFSPFGGAGRTTLPIVLLTFIFADRNAQTEDG